MRFLIFIAFASTVLVAAPHSAPNSVHNRAKELSSYLRKERKNFEKRESQRKDLVEEVDRLNKEQNQVRMGVAEFEEQQVELQMALENLELEVESQRRQEEESRTLLKDVLKTLYKTKRDGVLAYVFEGGDLKRFSQRLQTLMQSFRYGNTAVAALRDRVERLKQTETRLKDAQRQMQSVLRKSLTEEQKLKFLLRKKRQRLGEIKRKQRAFRKAEAEYRKVSSKLQSIFKEISKKKERFSKHNRKLKALPLPIEEGKVVRLFGKTTHKQFKTVSFHKGLEIEAPLKSPVFSVLPGIVEYEGWIKGMGNVVIIHHGEGFYSLSGHLFKIVAEKGKTVNPGEIIGFVGDTGRNENASLYFELRENSTAVNPMNYFAPDKLPKLTIVHGNTSSTG